MSSLRHISFATPAVPEYVGLVRNVVATTMSTWKSPVDCGDVILMLSEVFTNALEHAVAPASVATARIGVEVFEILGGLHIEVHDPDQGKCHDVVVKRARPQQMLKSGRGMELVEALSARWGQKGTDGGKYVYFDVLAPGTELGDVLLAEHRLVGQSAFGAFDVECAVGRSRSGISARIEIPA
jgi:anti-sigma regulatory factor (Ser/Thr protein kinase)